MALISASSAAEASVVFTRATAPSAGTGGAQRQGGHSRQATRPCCRCSGRTAGGGVYARAGGGPYATAPCSTSGSRSRLKHPVGGVHVQAPALTAGHGLAELHDRQQLKVVVTIRVEGRAALP